MARVVYENVTKKFGNTLAVGNLNLEVRDREFLVLVGPSGCGKSTVIRLLAGLEDVTEGEISMDGELVNDLSSRDRDVAMVFQSYALYPHMSVFDNMAFGLKMHGVKKDEIKRRVHEAAATLDIEPLLKRKPAQLSGGQRQRVALGRAIVREPKVFLFDEPLSNLDAKLRVQMRTELSKLHERLETTFIYVTHDQVEAMTMATRLAVLKDGYLQQVGTPEDLYFRPDNVFVAGFIGSPSMNFFHGRLVRTEDGGIWVETEGVRLPIPEGRGERLARFAETEVIFGVRPEDIYHQAFVPGDIRTHAIPVHVDINEMAGNERLLHVRANGSTFLARVDPRTRARTGEEIPMLVDIDRIHVFSAETERSLDPIDVPGLDAIPEAGVTPLTAP